ncbi:MarR family transcriptional regulator [Pseudonocardia kujensis]|uniref:MarR family winged helix-turn-helix transcriptional regulator n=1 Tax=Pseudonocardia kujensis TaxID=1128675 RepID=UPI001E5C9308|nr:MarR family transcriptional regulator [Pseudonocardia kujensis]MCE0761827.1 MarR family transcriptional regulator [Pseudonocardia kujensis]
MTADIDGAPPLVDRGGRTVDDHDIDVADRLVHELVMLMRLIKRIGPAYRGAELETASFPLLARLATEGPQRSGEIAAAMCADPSTISRQVAGLVRSGLVERRADPEDGRASLLAATTEGHRVLDTERRRRAGQLVDALADWTPESRGQFADLLGRFVADLHRTTEGDPR